MKIKCPFCNKILFLPDDMIIPLTGLCPNCGKLNSFNNVPSEVFPNTKYNENGDEVEPSTNEVKKLAEEMLKTIEEIKSGE